MKEKEFKKLKVGDKVRIVSKRPKHHDYCTCMDKWLGKVMTIRDTSYENKVRMVEDKGENWARQGWNWYPEMIAEKVEYPTIVEHLIRGNKTIVKLSNGKVGVAKCSPEDEFDYYEGLRIATARAYGKEYCTALPYEPYESKVKEVDRRAKVGEWIKITDAHASYDCYKTGDILKVYKRSEFNGGGVYCKMEKKFTDCNNDNGNILIFDKEYVVLENYNPKKKKVEEPKVKEVKRTAEVGEYIKIVNAQQSNKCYDNGDILKVYAFEYGEITHKRRGVFCNTKRRLPYDTTVSNNNGNPVIFDNEYVVLENYKPEKGEKN